MTEKFLSWKLPYHFNPDGGIKFTKISNPNTPYQYTFEPTGTNLFNYTQAKDMIEYITQGMEKEILVDELKFQILILYNNSKNLKTGVYSNIYKKDLKALLRVLNYNLVEDDYNSWVSENIDPNILKKIKSKK